METNLNSWFHHKLPHLQSSLFHSLDYPFNLGLQNDIAPSMSPCANKASPNGTLSQIAFPGVLQPKQFEPNESHGWLYGLSHFHQAFNDVDNTLPQEKAPHFPHGNHEETNVANPGPGTAQKRFLVFDQSGDQTTMFFSPGVGTPVRLTSENPIQKQNYHVNKVAGTDTFQHQEPVMTYDYHEQPKDDEESSEMHEDTEELNALLYSDDDYYYADEEEASTGHSPSTMTDFDKEEWAENEDEEVASNFGPNKRIKLSDGCFKVSTLADATSSAKLEDCSECDDDAASSCGDEENSELGGKKRLRKDQIRETLSLLQSIIPGGKCNGKDAILIFDEAIDYLKFLKVKAQALGVHSL